MSERKTYYACPTCGGTGKLLRYHDGTFEDRHPELLMGNEDIFHRRYVLEQHLREVHEEETSLPDLDYRALNGLHEKKHLVVEESASG